MGQAWDLDLPASKLLVLLAMADHADHNGNNVYPSVELIAWKTGYSESQARRIMKSLVKDEILSAQLRPGRTTLYSLHLDKGKLKEPFKRSNTGFQIDTPSTAMTPQGLHSYDTPTPSIAMTPEPSFEPSLNLSAKKTAIKPRATKSTATPKELLNPMADAIMAVFGWAWDTASKNEKSKVRAAAKQLCDAKRCPEEVPLFYAECKKRGWKNFTPLALANVMSDVVKRVSTRIIQLEPEPTDYPNTADYVNLAGGA